LNQSLTDSDKTTTFKYELDLLDYVDDKLKVACTVQGMKDEVATFCFPKIVPGIYGAMDFGQYINNITATDQNGKTLQIKRVDLNCWEVTGAQNISKLTYEVEDTWEEFDLQIKRGFYKSAASSFKEEAFIMNTNCMFGYFQNHDNAPVEVVISKPENYYGATGLNKSYSSSQQDRYKASSYHELVDNPMMYSKPDTSIIKLPNIDVEVACFSTSEQGLSADIAKHIRPLLENQTEYLGGMLPVDKYTFILYHNLNPDQNSYLGDGLEHSNSTLILFFMPMDINIIQDNVYGIASHEFFHTLMPLGIHSHEIANYDFNDPKFSRHLWLYEGTTEYFTIHMPIKNGLQSLEEFLEVVEMKIDQMQQFDKKLSFTELSLNAMDFQDQYYNVYLKGSLLNLCLDIKLRELSDGQYGVQNMVMGLLKKYGVNKSFEDEKLFEEIVAMTGYEELEIFFEKYVDGVEDMPLLETLKKVGLDLNNGKITESSAITKEQSKLRKAWINQ